MTQILGRTYRLCYTAKSFVSGLESIECKIIHPDLTIKGPFTLTEFEDPFMSGVYYYDFETVKEDQPGDYIFIINNTEQNLKEGVRVTYQSTETDVVIAGMAEGFQRNYFGG